MTPGVLSARLCCTGAKQASLPSSSSHHWARVRVSKIAARRALPSGNSKDKLYALHAPKVECISKGKARNPCEFGVKVSLAVTHKQGLMVGARSLPGNPYDGHVLSAN